MERIHGNRSQAQRTQALAGFRRGHFQVLVATDIAARGIDIDALSHVVNFDVPALPEDYIHRVGRTARAEALGDALTLVAPGEEADLRTIERAIGTRIARATLPGFDYGQRPVRATGDPPCRAHCRDPEPSGPVSDIAERLAGAGTRRRASRGRDLAPMALA